MLPLTTRNLSFLLWNVAVGLAAGAIVVRAPALAASLPLLWILLAMAAYEIAAGFVLGLRPGTLVSTPVRFLGLFVAFGLYLVVTLLGGT